MADKEEEQQTIHPLACTSCHARRLEEEEAAASSSRQLSRLKKNFKYGLFLIALTAFETGVILLFALTVLKFRTPKFRVQSAVIQTMNVGNTTNPSFHIKLKAEIVIKNTNFGHFGYENTTIYFYYEDTNIGKAFIREARAKARSTRKFMVNVKLTSAKVPTSSLIFIQDLHSGLLPISVQAKLRGRITILKLLKNNRSTNMNCYMDALLKKRQVKNLTCK